MWYQILFSCVCLLSYIIFRNMESKPNKVKYYSKLFVIYLYLLIVSILVSLYLIFKKRDLKNARKIAKCFMPLSKLYGMKWQLQNEEYVASEGGAVIISNHQSSLDAIGVIYIFDKINKAAAIVKKELWCLGVIAYAAYKCGTVFINRHSPKTAHQTLEKLTKVLTTDRSKIWIFPEGTRNAGTLKLLPFKKGAFALAVAAQVPIIPIVFSPHYFINEKKCIFYNDGKIIIRCLEPVPTEGMTSADIPELQERLHKIMMEAFAKLSKETLNDLPLNTSLATEILL